MNENEQVFAVIAESNNYEKPLYLLNLPFPRLMDDVVVPYQSRESFFIDGVSVAPKDLKRIKIVLQNASFAGYFEQLHMDLRLPQTSSRRVPAGDYEVRLQALFRDAGDDVTSQAIAAYQAKIGEKLKEYLPNKKQLIDAAFQVFIQSIASLGKGGS